MPDKKIPGVPTIGNIQDQEVRKALQALSEGWRVRNGETRDEGAQFVTRDDIERYISTGGWQTSNAGVGNRIQSGQMARGGVGAAFRSLVQSIISEIQGSALWKRLSASVDKLDGPNGVLSRIGLTEAGIKRFEAQTNNKIEVIEGILVQPDGTTLAAIVEERVAEIADGLARTLNQTTLQTMANGGSVLAQEALQISQPASVEGKLDVSWTVKFDVDGYVVGAGLGLEGKDGNYTSQFLVRADRFAIGSPTVPDVFPFIVDSRPDGSVIALNGQVYIGASTAEDLAANASVPPITSVGQSASPPSTTGLKRNSVYLNTTDGNSYILYSDGGAWTLWLQKGASGSRGSITAYASGGSWSDSTANNAIINATGSSWKTIGDTVTISNGSSFAETRYWSGGAWVSPGVVIDGNLIASGTISATKIFGGTLGGVTIRVGSGSTPSGNAFEVSSSGVFWVDNVFGGSGRFTAGHSTAPASCQGVAEFSWFSHDGVRGSVAASNSNSGCHGVRGVNYNKGTSGVVGVANNYDFYADGSGTNYGPFTGAHDALLPKATTLTPGDIVADVQCVARNGLSNTLHVIEGTSHANQKGVVGVFIGKATNSLDDFLPAGIRDSWEAYCTYRTTHDYVAFNALGEGQINVCGEGGDLEPGDLIVASSIPGKGMKQADDIVRSYTVAKCREHVVFDNPAEVRQVSCIYLCG